MENHILSHWDSQAKKHGKEHSASWGDKWVIALEIENISKYIREGDKVLDVGCSNGHAAVQHISKNVQSINGVDFSSEMIEQANLVKANHPESSKLSFQQGNVLSLPFDDNIFDVVYTTRTLINLPTWENQKIGIRECLRVCKEGGTVIFSEAFWEPLVLLNSMRSLKNLKPLVEHDFNRYLKIDRTKDFLQKLEKTYDIIDFSSLYYLGSRFIRELVMDPDAYPNYTSPISKLFFEIEKDYSGGGFGLQQAFVVTN